MKRPRHGPKQVRGFGEIDENLEVCEVVAVDTAWSGQPVDFCLLTFERYQFVAFYDEQRTMTVGKRDLLSQNSGFELVRLPSKVSWDSHNGISLGLDSSNCLHVAGNMHASPLLYFRSTVACDVSSLELIPAMLGEHELEVTYPSFSRSHNEELLFSYRSGRSGNGIEIVNIYDTKTKQWSRLHDAPLFDGEGKNSAYSSAPVLGEDGYYHRVWVWRNSYDAATNHSPSYARSRDLINWEAASGKPYTLPITLSSSEVIDPVPPGAGLINNNVRVSLDRELRPIVSYHKYDDRGFTQLYNARFENGRWIIYQSSSWRSRWDFGGGGTIPFQIHVHPTTCDGSGTLRQEFDNVCEGWGVWTLDHQTLQPLRTDDRIASLRDAIFTSKSNDPEMKVNLVFDGGPRTLDKSTLYIGRWESLREFRDAPRSGNPPPSTFTVYTLDITREPSR